MVSSEHLVQFDRRLGRHAWLQLTPPAAIERARGILEKAPQQSVVYDPFAGTATTGIVAANLGHRVYLGDSNPFLVWFGDAKSRNYNWGDLAALQVRLDRIWDQVRSYADTTRKNWQPTFSESALVWSPEALHVLAAIRRALAEEYGEPRDRAINEASPLIWIAFCQLLLETTEATLPPSAGTLVEGIWYLYQEILDRVVESVADALVGSVQVTLSDARQAPATPMRATHTIATPPAPNRQSETKPLSPFMAWLRFLSSLEEAGTYEWQALGGTWGFPPQNLANWRPTVRELPPALGQTLKYVRHINRRGAPVVAQYYMKYFHDLFLHLMNLRGSLAEGARLYYFTTNTSYNSIPIHTEHILKETFHMLGYIKVSSQPLEASDRGTQNFCVVAQYQGN